MNLLLFAGFLGSGKTTLIRTFAQRLTDEGLTACFIVNEVGEVGIDGRVLGDGGLDVYEITAGCICCEIASSLVTTAEQIVERYHPDLLVIEASGIAAPEGVLKALAHRRGELYQDQLVVSLVDPTRLEMLLAVALPLTEAQVRGADELVITKLDEATPDELTAARETLEDLAPQTRVSEITSDKPESLHPLLGRLAAFGAAS